MSSAARNTFARAASYIVPAPEEVGFYEYHRWAMSPRQAITQSMADALRAHSLFKSVAVHERGIEAAYVLTGNIERLEEVDQGRDVRAVCTISAQLMDARTGSVVWSHTASEAVRVQTTGRRGRRQQSIGSRPDCRRSPGCVRREGTLRPC